MRTHTRKLVYILGAILLATIVVRIGISYYLKNREANNLFRCHVFEELLQPGMTRAEVENILGEFGQFDLGESWFSESNFRLDIVYKDPEINKRFGGYIVLQFSDGGYMGAYYPYGVGDAKDVCER